jgi:hypothetical protein
MCPVFKSPNDDNGYNISDYRDIMDEFGILADSVYREINAAVQINNPDSVFSFYRTPIKFRHTDMTIVYGRMKHSMSKYLGNSMGHLLAFSLLLPYNYRKSDDTMCLPYCGYRVYQVTYSDCKDIRAGRAYTYN